MDIQPINALMVEDSEIVILSQQVLLEQYKFKLDIARTGYDAIDYAANKTYQLIILDLGLPDIDGIEVAKQIQASGKNTKTPIVSITAQHDTEQAQECLAAGVARVFRKPMVLATCSEIRQFVTSETGLLTAM